VSELFQRLENAVNKRCRLSQGQKILAAVSGGADSMALLHLLHSLAKTNRWKISVAHFNHRLRGRASDADEKLVRRTAAKLRLKFFAGGADVGKIAAQSKLSVEMAARKLRHEFLARVAREQKISTIALAHHADDQVELFFLRLLRGAGGEGLAGMKWRSPSPADKNISLVRPLLGFAKAEMLALARENKIRFRDDATNFSAAFLRNRIRNELLPLLREKYQPGLDKAVLRLMEIVGAEAEFVSESAQEWLHNFRFSRGNEAQTKIGNRQSAIGNKNKSEPPHVGGCKFDDLPLAVQRKVLQQQLSGFGLMPDFELIEQLRETSGKWVAVCAGMSVSRDAAGKVCCREHPATEFNPAELKLTLAGRSGGAEFGGRKFRWQIQTQKNSLSPPQQLVSGTPALQECFDADQIGHEIILRHWHAGDRFQPIGMNSSVKLQDLFVNAKIPAARRRKLVLAATATGEIFWVEGLRIGERFKLSPDTSRKLRWNWSKDASCIPAPRSPWLATVS
jgi:tRNA(Ile)-lysidine synthase